VTAAMEAGALKGKHVLDLNTDRVDYLSDRENIKISAGAQLLSPGGAPDTQAQQKDAQK
jgi:hypothetical protein